MNHVFQNLATYFAKSFLIIFFFALLVITMKGQKKAESQSSVIQNPIAVHKKLHKGQDWWTWMQFDNIKLSQNPRATNPNGGEFSYQSFKVKDGKQLSMLWDTKTIFQVFHIEGEIEIFPKNRCFFVIYCQKHNLALQAEERPCSLLEQKNP